MGLTFIRYDGRPEAKPVHHRHEAKPVHLRPEAKPVHLRPLPGRKAPAATPDERQDHALRRRDFCPAYCPAWEQKTQPAGNFAVAINCPVRESQGRWGWPCHLNLAEMTEGGGHV